MAKPLTDQQEPEGTTAAASLEGIDLGTGWHVQNRIVPSPTATGGTFSESYAVKHESGRLAFLKAFDYSEALRQPNAAEALQALTNAYIFERDLLIDCASARMSRVVLALEHGEVNVPGFGLLSRVNYLILEKADRDVRSQRDLWSQIDIAWSLRALHHVATGLQQLHGRGISHQDLKPSNVLVFDNEGYSKVGDLGRAAQQGRVAPHDPLPIAGDRTYAPPELLYGAGLSDRNLRRRACDMYHLGSMELFFFQGVGTTAALAAELDPAHRWGTWTEDFPAVLPFVRDAFDRVADELEEVAPPEYRSDVGATFRALCDPDPEVRGNPRAPSGSVGRYQMATFVSRFDLLARDAELKLRKAQS